MFIQPVNEAALFCDRNKFARSNRPKGRRRPPRESFKADNALGFELKLRLVMHVNRGIRDGNSQLTRKRRPPFSLPIHARFEKANQ